MKELLSAVEKLASEELSRSYHKFPAFNSPHEGYAVILEEIFHATAEAVQVAGGMPERYAVL